MSKFKDLMLDILEMYEQGHNVAEVAQHFQLRRNIVEYVIETYGPGIIDDSAIANTTQG
jgi:uncharacterized protein (DUF433 family)